MAVGPGWRDYRPSSRLHSTARVIEAYRRSLMLGYSTLVVGDDHRGTCVIPWRAPRCSAAGATAFPPSERRGLRIRTIPRQPSLLRVVGMTVTAAINGHDLNNVTSSEQRMRHAPAHCASGAWVRRVLCCRPYDTPIASSSSTMAESSRTEITRNWFARAGATWGYSAPRQVCIPQ